MKIERANLAVCVEIALQTSIKADATRMVSDESVRTQQIRDALEAIENGEQLEIVD